MAPTLFSKFIPNILPRAVESELSEYAAQDQKLQRELIQNGFTRQVFFSFGDKICPFPRSVWLGWGGMLGFLEWQMLSKSQGCASGRAVCGNVGGGP